MNPYSLVITSCDRHDLLQITMESFMDSCNVPPREIIVVEDGPTPMPPFMRRFGHLGLKWFNNTVRRGQLYTVDKAYREVTNEYIFHCEDDWKFVESGYIKESFDILEQHPEIFTVSLRGVDCNGHPLSKDPRFPFLINEPNWRGKWGSFHFNPGARRKSDWQRIGSYGRHICYGTHGLAPEIILNKMYYDMGYRIAALDARPTKEKTYAPYIIHTGNDRSRAIEPINTKPPKILVGIKAGHRLHYSKWESSQSPYYNKETAFKHEPYGWDIHLSLQENPRIAAVRETWWQDIKSQPMITGKFFFGKGAKRPPLEDEVFLPVEDGYEYLPHKTIAICKYALEHDYDYAFLCDDDTGVYVDRLVAEVLNQSFDYAGYLQGVVCTGGVGYWLSRTGLEAVQENPNVWAEDVWVGKCMKYANVEPTMLTGHRPGGTQHYFFADSKFDPKLLDDKIVTMHAMSPDTLREWWAYTNKNRRR